MQYQQPSRPTYDESIVIRDIPNNDFIIRSPQMFHETNQNFNTQGGPHLKSFDDHNHSVVNPHLPPQGHTTFDAHNQQDHIFGHSRPTDSHMLQSHSLRHSQVNMNPLQSQNDPFIQRGTNVHKSVIFEDTQHRANLNPVTGMINSRMNNTG